MGFTAWWQALARMFCAGTAMPHEFAFLLETPLRRLVLPPDVLARRLHLRPNARVLELGPGPGCFSRSVARELPQGFLCLCDLQPAMLTRARRKCQRAGLDNVAYVAADARALPFVSGVFDRIFTVAVLGEVPDPSSAIAEVRRCLATSGLFVNTEQPGDPDHLPLETLRPLVEEQGLRQVATEGRDRNYSATFRPTVEHTPG